MYSFEGQYRRVPKQNLAGASVQPKKDELLHKVHEERMKREVIFIYHNTPYIYKHSYQIPSSVLLQENRRKLQCAIRIQAFIRSFLIRQRLKEQQRQEYDNLVRRLQNARIDATETNDLISILTTKLVFFYHPSKDVKRLVIYCFFLYYLKVSRNFT